MNDSLVKRQKDSIALNLKRFDAFRELGFTTDKIYSENYDKETGAHLIYPIKESRSITRSLAWPVVKNSESTFSKINDLIKNILLRYPQFRKKLRELLEGDFHHASPLLVLMNYLIEQKQPIIGIDVKLATTNKRPDLEIKLDDQIVFVEAIAPLFTSEKLENQLKYKRADRGMSRILEEKLEKKEADKLDAPLILLIWGFNSRRTPQDVIEAFKQDFSLKPKLSAVLLYGYDRNDFLQFAYKENKQYRFDEDKLYLIPRKSFLIENPLAERPLTPKQKQILTRHNRTVRSIGIKLENIWLEIKRQIKQL
ncbi:hypothetical protein H0O03_04760 [Candidatus Micrarchaeota archaeon]|nr:hypothetical protein [Candidatus Micrarchaeota archaeon]